VWSHYFFEGDDVIVMVTSNRYCAMLENFLRPKLNLFDEHGAENVFHQDGATAHTSHRSLGILRGMFPGHVVSLRGGHRVATAFARFDPVRFFPLVPNSKPRYTNIIPKVWKVLKR
jgi:hypothetical protein